MLYNYLLTALRNLRRHRLHTLISILGLALGIGTAVLLLRYVQYELGFDAYHPNLDRIYRVMEVNRQETQTQHTRFVTSAVAKALREEIPEVESAAHAHRIWVKMKVGEKTLGGIRVAAMEQEMFDILDIDLIAGSVEELYADPSGIAMTRRTARRFFGKEDPIGKVVSVESGDYGGERVVRVLVADQSRSHFRFDYIQPPTWRHSWTGWRGNTYVLLRDGADPHAAESKFPAILARHLEPDVASRRTLELYPFSRVYLHLTHDYNMGVIYEPWGDIAQVRLFGSVAILILLISCINFTNLSIARSGHRAREVGMRKVTGAMKRQLTVQFLSESVLVACVSMLLGLVALQLVLPEFNSFFRRSLQIDLFADPSLVFGLAGITLLVGLAAGAYPALILSSLEPTETLSGTYRGILGGQWIRKGLVVLQFAASIALVIGSGVIYVQFEFIRTSDFGYDRSDHLVHMNPYVTDKFSGKEVRLADRYEAVKQAFMDHPDVLEGTAFCQDFGLTTWGTQKVQMEGQEDRDWQVPILEVDDDFIDVFRINVLAGRNFDGDTFPADHAGPNEDSGVGFIVNESAVEYLGWDLDAPPGAATAPLGKAVRWKFRRGDITGSVIGVVNDFHYLPLTERIGPLLLAFRTKSFFNLTVRVREGRLDEAMPHLEKTWKHFAPNNPFGRWFWEANLRWGYKQQRRTQALAHVVSGIAIFLACIGLFGLASHAADVRRKEISVRKVLGASTPSLVSLVSREFTVLVLIAGVLAIPVSYPFVRDWLNEFAYRMELGPGPFVAGILLTLVISQITVTYHAVRAARTDPAEVLRKE